MSFGAPLYLIGLIAVPLLWLFLFWAGRSREKALARLGEMGLVGKLAESLNARGRRWQQRLWLAAIALIIFSLARPQWGTSTNVVQQDGIQVMVALDISSSMLAQDLQPDRLTRAKQTILELMDQLNGDQIGLALFSGASFIQFPLTNDYATAKSFLISANPGMISRPGTAIAQAIRTARQGFDQTRSSQKVIVVMTDGENHEGDVFGEARDAAEDDIIIYTIGFGSPDGEPIPAFDAFGSQIGFKQDFNGTVILSRLDEDTLRDVAETTGGKYFRASASGAEIVALGELIDQLETAELESRFEVQAVERFPIFLMLGIIAFIAAEFIPERQRRSRRSFEQLVGVLVMGVLLVGCAGERGAQLVADGNEQFSAEVYDAAQSNYSEALAAGVTNGVPIYNTANTQFRQGQYPESALTMGEALNLADEALSAEAWFNLGNSHFVQEEWKQAVEAYKEALRVNPEDVDAKYNLELALNQIQQEQEQEEQQQDQDEQQEPNEDSEEQEQDQSEEQEDGEEEPAEEQPAEEDPATPEDEGEEEPTPTPESGEGDPSEDDSEEEQDQGGSDGEQESESEPSSPEQSNPNAGDTGDLTEEQAIQLLDAIEQGTETLQERLQQIYTVPGPPPTQDY